MTSATARPVLIVACFLTAGCGVDGQASKPDLSGTWVLDLSASSLEIPLPDSSVFVVEHAEPIILAKRTHVVGGVANTVESRFSTDSLVRPVLVGEVEIPTRVYWDGEALVLDQAWSRGGVRITNVVRYTLGSEGRTMVADEWMRAGSERHHNVWVFRRR